MAEILLMAFKLSNMAKARHGIFFLQYTTNIIKYALHDQQKNYL
jgi:hypothetical protein